MVKLSSLPLAAAADGTEYVPVIQDGATKRMAVATIADASTRPTDSEIQTAVVETFGAGAISKGDIGLGNVDNTADTDKPVSTAQQTALNAKAGLTALAAQAGAALIGFITSGVGAAARTVQAKLRDIGSPEDFGAVGDGAADDSATFSALITGRSQGFLSAGKSYSVKDIVLSNSQSIRGIGQNVNAAAAATNLFVLQDYNPRLAGVYISAATNAAEAAVRIKKSRYAAIVGVTAVNCGPGFIKLAPVTPATEAIAMPNLDNSDAEGITGIGVEIDSSVSEVRASNLHLSGLLTAGVGGNTRPMFTTTGWRQNTTVQGGIAVGGHQVANVNLIGFNRGLYLTDAQLSKFTNCVADSCADYAVLLDGACQYIDFHDLFVGTTRGIKVMGTSRDIHFDGLRTVFGGVIPPWGSTDFFNGVATFYDLEVRDTAQVRVSNWQGSKRIAVDATAKLILMDGTTYNGRSVGAPGAGITTFLSEWGATATEGDTLWRVPYDCYIVRLCPCVPVAPGAGQSFTYTARLNFADTALTAQISGTNFGNADAWAGALIPASKGDQISIKLVTSATAAASRHQVQMQIVPR